MTETTPIPGGYILYPRLFIEQLENAPLLDRVLWLWLLCRANHSNHSEFYSSLKRGQLVATTEHMREALQHRSGYCMKKPSRDRICKALERLRSGGMIDTRRTSRGLVVTLCDYDRYQDPAAYGRRYDRSVRSVTGDTHGRYDRQEGKNEKKGKGTSCSFNRGTKTFEEIDRERAERALAQAQEKFLSDD